MRITSDGENRVLVALVSLLIFISFTEEMANIPVWADFFRTRSPSEPAVSFAGTRNADYKSTGFILPLSKDPSGTLLITSANDGQTFQNLKITSKSGNCVTVTGAANITIQNVEIGPCGGRGIEISGSSGINIYDSYIHTETLSPGCCDNNDGIYAQNKEKGKSTAHFFPQY